MTLRESYHVRFGEARQSCCEEQFSGEGIHRFPPLTELGGLRTSPALHRYLTGDAMWHPCLLSIAIFVIMLTGLVNNYINESTERRGSLNGT